MKRSASNPLRSIDPKALHALGPLLSKLVAHRVGQQLGRIPWEQEPKDRMVRLLGYFLSDTAFLSHLGLLEQLDAARAGELEDQWGAIESAKDGLA